MSRDAVSLLLLLLLLLTTAELDAFLAVSKPVAKPTSKLVVSCRAPKDGTEDDDDNNDTDFLESFRRAANSKLGSPIPSTEFVADSANQAQTDFLAAMQQAKQDFAQAKEQTGGDVNGAIDLILEKIEQEEQEDESSFQ